MFSATRTTQFDEWTFSTDASLSSGFVRPISQGFLHCPPHVASDATPADGVDPTQTMGQLRQPASQLALGSRQKSEAKLSFDQISTNV